MGELRAEELQAIAEEAESFARRAHSEAPGGLPDVAVGGLARGYIEGVTAERKRQLQAARDGMATLGMAVDCLREQRDELLQALRLVEDLGEEACMFDLCPGPDEPFVGMATCRACEAVQAARAAVAKAEGR
jgi:hypothetical protein